MVLACLVIATQTGNTHWSVEHISWILFGAATGAVFGPLFTLARDDGEDDEVYRAEHAVDGRADTSTEGAFAQDRAHRERG